MSQLRIRRQPTRWMIARTYAVFWALLIGSFALFAGICWEIHEIVKAWGWFA